MSPRTENMESYGKLCRERATKSMCKNKQIQVLVKNVGLYHMHLSKKTIMFVVFQVIDNATGMYMWPTPGTAAPTGTFVPIFTTLNTHYLLLFFFSYRCENTSHCFVSGKEESDNQDNGNEENKKGPKRDGGGHV